MSKNIISLILFFAGLSIYNSCTNKITYNVKPAKPPISHEVWDGLVKKHVQPDGFVDYVGFVQDSAKLNIYLSLLESSHPQKSWSEKEQKAYWVNAYNAFTIKLIVDNYPVASIKDIKKGIPFVNSIWDDEFIDIQGEIYDLNGIEHGILRKNFPDGRIHAAINCASYSCPRLRNEAFTADRLESQLEDAMRLFVNDPLRNRVTAEKAELSKIFSWFGGDFKKDAGSVREFVNHYANEPLEPSGKISHLKYDWRLNDVKSKSN